jgi:hypothetical protein
MVKRQQFVQQNHRRKFRRQFFYAFLLANFQLLLIFANGTGDSEGNGSDNCPVGCICSEEMFTTVSPLQPSQIFILSQMPISWTVRALSWRPFRPLGPLIGRGYSFAIGA